MGLSSEIRLSSRIKVNKSVLNMSQNTTGSERPNDPSYPKKKVKLKEGDTTKTTSAANSNEWGNQGILKFRGANGGFSFVGPHPCNHFEQTRRSSFTAQNKEGRRDHLQPRMSMRFDQTGSPAFQSSYSITRAPRPAKFYPQVRRVCVDELQSSYHTGNMLKSIAVGLTCRAPSVLSGSQTADEVRLGPDRQGTQRNGTYLVPGESKPYSTQKASGECFCYTWHGKPVFSTFLCKYREW